MQTQLIVAAGLSALLLSGCDNGTAASTVDYSALLTTLTVSDAVPGMTTFAADADALVTATAALEAAPSATTLAASQAAWRTVRADYRRLDGVHIGPVMELGIDSRIDSPANDTEIDGIIAGTQVIDSTMVAALGNPDKGFLGMEYLMFSSAGSTQVLNAMQGSGVPLRRRTFASVMAQELASSAHQLVDAWNGSMGYTWQVQNAGGASTVYISQRAALNDFFNGVSSALELVVGSRLAIPLGLKSEGVADPDSASDSAVADMTATLSGVTALYEGQGWSSRVSMQSALLDTTMTQQLKDCAAKIAAIPSPFDTTVKSDAAVVQAAYTSCKTLKATWNTDVSSALGAAVTPDLDGD